MGSGAKIALVALLILMVVAVAKFVQNGKEDEAPTVASKKDAGAQAKVGANGPRLADPKTPRTPGTGQVLTSRQPISGAAVAPGTRTPATGVQTPGPIGGQTGQTAVQPGIPRPPGEVRPAAAPPTARESTGPSVPPLVSSAGGAPVPIGSSLPSPAPPPESKKVEGTIAPPNPDLSRPREEGKTTPPPAVMVVSQNPATQAERESPSPALKKSAEPPTPGVIGLVADEGQPVPKNEALPRGQAKAFPINHLVEPGESYWRIAEKYYGSGNGRLHSTISAANGGGKLIAGKTISIPAPPPSLTSPPKEPGIRRETTTPTESTKPSRPTGGIVSSDARYDYYQVQKGDTLTGLAKRFLGGAGKVAALEAANPSLRYETLREGARIRIPKK
jgi:LysM repeat protein